MKSEQAPLKSGDWDGELYNYWVRTELSAHSLWMAELTMRLFGRKKAYAELDLEMAGVSSACVQFPMF